MDAPSSRTLALAVGLTTTGVLALADAHDAVLTALVATAGAWWVLGEQEPAQPVEEDTFLAPDDLIDVDPPHRTQRPGWPGHEQPRA